MWETHGAGRCSNALSLDLGDSQILVFDFEPQAVEHAHIDVRDPYQGKLGNDITPPSEAEYLKVRQQ
jgi:hypothetical protein